MKNRFLYIFLFFFAHIQAVETQKWIDLEAKWSFWLEDSIKAIAQLQHCVDIDNHLLHVLGKEARTIIQERQALFEKMEDPDYKEHLNELKKEWEELDKNWQAWGDDFSTSIQSLEQCSKTDEILLDLDSKRKQLIQERLQLGKKAGILD